MQEEETKKMVDGVEVEVAAEEVADTAEQTTEEEVADTAEQA